jgi:hypothetical protein
MGIYLLWFCLLVLPLFNLGLGFSDLSSGLDYWLAYWTHLSLTSHCPDK